MDQNPGCELGDVLTNSTSILNTQTFFTDLGWLNSINVNLAAVHDLAAKLGTKEIKGVHRAAWILKSITLIDLTTLGGDDTHGNVSRLCFKVHSTVMFCCLFRCLYTFQAARPLAEDLLKQLGFQYDNNCPINTAAVCVYPAKVKDAVQCLKQLGYYDKINVASGI